MKSGWEHQEKKRCFLFPLAFTAVSAQYFLIGCKSACELPIKITLKTIWNMTYLWDHDHITLICEGVSFLHFFLGKWERALFSVHFVMYGIKQASNLVKMIYTSHTWNYFPPFILWCGARKAVNKSLTFPTRVKPLTRGLLRLIDPVFPGSVEDALRGGGLLLCSYPLGTCRGCLHFVHSTVEPCTRPAHPLEMKAWFLIRASQPLIQRENGYCLKEMVAVSLIILFISHVALKHFAKE